MTAKKVVVAFSGGKDSTAAALILKKAKYRVQLITMMVGTAGEADKIENIKKLASVIDIPLSLMDARSLFKVKVINEFLNAYQSGLTPNPCVTCNVSLKFGWLWNLAFAKFQADMFATGHYADRIERAGDMFLREPQDRDKSQIYFLSMIGVEKLRKTIFPLSTRSLDQVRDMVRDLPLAHKEESQDVCFLSGQSLNEYLNREIPGMIRKGDIVDVQGKRIGSHDGIMHFTIGQRRGTRFSSDRKLYVIGKDVKNNTIILGEDKDLFSDEIRVRLPVYWRPLRPGEVLRAKIRYMSRLHEIEILETDQGHIRGKFTCPVRAVAPGQICVFYQEDIIVAAGVIV